jgi:hypothetical protein
MNNDQRTFHVGTSACDELEEPPSITKAEALRMTQRTSVASPVPMLLRDALNEESWTKGLSRTMLRVTHHLRYWEREGRIIIGGSQ